MRPSAFTLLLAIAGLLFSSHTAFAQSTSAPVHVALVSSCGESPVANNGLAMAEAALSRNPGIALVDRAEVERILREHFLERCGLSDVRQALAVGRLLPVELFAAIESYGPDSSSLGIVVFNAASGVRLWDAPLSGSDAVRNAESISDAVTESAGKWHRLERRPRTVCLLRVRNLGLPREMNSACDAVGRMVEQGLVASPDLALVERQHLEQINRERNLSASGSSNDLLASTVLLDIEIARSAVTNGLIGTVFLTSGTGDVLDRVEARIAGQDPAGLPEALLPELLRALHAAPATEVRDRSAEARRFVDQSRFLRNDGDISSALRLAEAAAALDPHLHEIQVQLGRCLAAHAFHILRVETNVSGSLPLAIRAAGILREARVRSTADGHLPDHELMAAEEILTTRSQQGRGYWERTLMLLDGQEPETRQRALELQRELRDIRLHLNVELYRSRVRDGLNALAYGGAVNDALCNAEKFAPSSAVWTGDVLAIMNKWLDVFETRELRWGGWSIVFTRTMARLCCQAGGCDEQGFAHRFQEIFGKVPRFNGWQLQSADLEKLRALFERMENHSDPIVQCYGRIGLLGLQLRGASQLTGETALQYESAKQFVRDQIERQWPEERTNYYGHAYGAARDLIDIVPDAAFRRREHLDLFELSMQRRDVVYWTVVMASDPAACRFAQYSRWPEPFPIDPAGNVDADCASLLANAQRALELFESENRHDVDGSKFSFITGSFDREVAAMRNRILEKCPELAASKDFSSMAPPMNAEKLFQIMNPRWEGRIRCIAFGPSNVVYAVIVRTENGTNLADCVRIPLDGRGGGLLATLPLPGFTGGQWVSATVDGEVLYVGHEDTGVFAVPLNGGSFRLIDRDAGLLSSNVRSFTAASGKLYAMLAEGHFVVWDPETRSCEILASSRARDKRSPLDGITPAFEILSMLHDAPRGRILFSTRFHERRYCFGPIGLWQLDLRTREISQVFETHYPISWMQFNGDDELLVFCPRTQSDAPCMPAFYSVIALDLASDNRRLLWGFNKDRPAGPGLPAELALVRRELHATPPFLLRGDLLWLTANGHARLSLKTGSVESINPPEPTMARGRPGWIALQQFNGGELIVAADDTRVWRIDLADE